jgi:hypothetical protein
MAGNSIVLELKLRKKLTARFHQLPKWKQRLLMEDLECALESRLKVLGHT